MPAAVAVVDVGVIIVCIGLLILAFLLIQLGSNAPSFPIVGNIIEDDITGPLVTLIDNTADFLLQVVVIDVGVLTFHESIAALRGGGDLLTAVYAFMQGVVDDTSDILVAAFAAIINWALPVLGSDNLAFLQDLYYILQVRLTNVEVAVGYLTGDLLNLSDIQQTVTNFVLNAVAAPLGFLSEIVQDEEIQIEQLHELLTPIMIAQLPFIETILEDLATRLAADEAKIAAIPADIGDLVTDIPRLRGEVNTIEGELGGLAGEIEGLLTDFGTLTGLLGLAAVGALALDFLIEFAKNPCSVFEITCDYTWVKPAVVDQMLLNGV